MRSRLGFRLHLAFLPLLLIAALACNLGAAASPAAPTQAALPPTEAPPTLEATCCEETESPPAQVEEEGPAIEVVELPPTSDPGAQPQGGHITFTMNDQRVFRVAVEAGASAEDVSAALGELSQGTDDGWLNISPDGEWLVLNTDRFDPECVGWPCLAILPSDLSSSEVVSLDGVPLHPSTFAAVSNGGNVIVYGENSGPHELDLWAISRSGGEWAGPTLLTGDSPYQFQATPSILADGSATVFECADQPYGAPGTALCEVSTNGAGFEVLMTPAAGPGGSEQNALHEPAFAPDGSIVFEADWRGEQVWRMPGAGGEPELINPAFNNDNSPCVLPDGRIVSLWVERPGGSSVHELKVMAADGSDYLIVLPDVDVFDVGIGCGD